MASERIGRSGRHGFPNTRWSLVLRAASPERKEAHRAVSTLCELYWYPLYAFLRRSGHAAPDAEDLVQSFFLRCLEKDTFLRADEEKGTLRTYLLACLRNYVSDAARSDQTRKRGAGRLVSFDGLTPEERYAAEPVDGLSPDGLYDRQWAILVLECAMQALHVECAADGKTAEFEALRGCLETRQESAEATSEVAAALGIPPEKVKHRRFEFRRRWRAHVFAAVAETIEDPTRERIEGEVRLFEKIFIFFPNPPGQIP